MLRLKKSEKKKRRRRTLPRLMPYFTFFSAKIECVPFLFSTSTTRFHEIRLHNFCLVLLTDTHKELPLAKETCLCTERSLENQ